MKVKTIEKYGAVVIELKGNVMGGPEAQEFSDTLHKLISENYMFNNPIKAKDAEKLVWTKSSFREYPDLFIF